MENRSSATQRAVGLALAITVVLAIAKVAVWAGTGSLAVLAQALDSVLDVVTLGLVAVALRVAARPPDPSHHFGHSKAEHLAAFAETLVLGGLVVMVSVTAIERLVAGVPAVDAPLGAIALLAGSAVVDAGRAWVLISAARSHSSDALKAGALNVVADIATVVVTVASLVAVRRGVTTADPIGALVVSAMVVMAAFPIARRSIDVLMDRAPSQLEAAIAGAAEATPGVTETRRVRVRGDTGGVFADLVVAAGRTTSLERAHDIAEEVERAVERAVPGVDVVVHVEPIAEGGGLVERVQAAASRTAGVHEIHNVSVHEFFENGAMKLHATLHAKGDATMSVSQSHDLADRIEQSVRDELGADVRVDTHIEPLQPAHLAADVTASHGELVRFVEGLAESQPDVADCHEVVVTSAAGRLSVVAHVRGAADLPLERIHDASERIEAALLAKRPDVAAVLIHFEPT